MRNQKLILVRFVTANAPYMAGETAGFPPEVAQRFIDRKRAVLHVPPKEGASEAPAKEEAPPPAAEAKAAPKPKAKARAKKKAAKKK